MPAASTSSPGERPGGPVGPATEWALPRGRAPARLVPPRGGPDGHLATAPATLTSGQLLDSFDSHVAVVDADGTIVAINAAWDAFSRANDGSRTGVGENYFAVCVDADDATADQALAGLQQVLSGECDRFDQEYPCHAPDELRWFRLTATPLLSTEGTKLVVRHDSITAEYLAREGQRIRGELLEHLDVAVVATGADGEVEVWNRAAWHLFGHPPADAVGRPLGELIVPVDEGAAAQDPFEVAADTGHSERFLEVEVPRRGPVPVELRDRLVYDVDGGLRGLLRVAVDLTERVARERSLARDNTWLRAITDRMGEGLCTLDADGRVAYVNPTGEWLLGASNGHVIGGSFVNRLLGRDEDGEQLAFGDQLIGAEFDGELPAEAQEDRLLRNDGSVLPVEYVATPLPPEADGRPGGWVVTFRDITTRLAEREHLQQDAQHARWMARIQDALDHDRFVLYGQPIVDLATGRTVQHELLLRLDDPDEGIIPPGAFLPTAEAYGLATAIDRWVVEQAVDLAALGHSVELNLSARSLDDPTLTAFVESLLRDRAVDASLLVFEITETALLEHRDEALRFAQHARQLGCQLALDDFGTGYGAFTYLKHLPVDVLKIDMDFTRDAVSNPASRHVIGAVVNLARAFELQTIAEGVEDAETLELLRDLGVDQVQGYHLGRPAPLGETVLADGRERNQGGQDGTVT